MWKIPANPTWPATQLTQTPFWLTYNDSFLTHNPLDSQPNWPDPILPDLFAMSIYVTVVEDVLFLVSNRWRHVVLENMLFMLFFANILVVELAILRIVQFN